MKTLVVNGGLFEVGSIHSETNQVGICERHFYQKKTLYDYAWSVCNCGETQHVTPYLLTTVGSSQRREKLGGALYPVKSVWHNET